ncbi:MAG: hypothetical protein KFF73_02885 [Cyclobacteriaceae bacterium]|nr:hypothetical protein [Cyclobacteriaceae bacterium]
MNRFLTAGLVFILLNSGCMEQPGDALNDPSEILLMKKKIDLEQSDVLFRKETFNPQDLSLFTFHHSEWTVEDGWLVGKNPGNHPGMAILKQDFSGNVLVEFLAQTISPSTHDINVMWNGEWIDSIDQRGTAYVAGLEGWWTGKVGIEKSPDYNLMLGTPLFDFQPGKIYKIQAGSIEGHCFILADGKLLLEGMDPDPIDHQRYTRIGFEAYSSHIRLKNVVIRRLNWKHVDMHYDPEF